MNKGAAIASGGAHDGNEQAVVPGIPDHTLLRCIGRGSYGEVWLARTVLGEHRAVKIVYRSRFEHDRPYEREFEGIRKFEPISRSHESQVDILHVGRNDEAGYFYYVMELADDASAQGSGFKVQSSKLAAAESEPRTLNVEHRTLNSGTYVPHTLKIDLYRRSRLPVAECIDIGLSLCHALQHLHEHDLVHRDIKPSNIIFIGGIPKLADIGLVASMDATMSFVGTSGFVPPEGPGAPQGDIYSLGKVLYEISMGRDRTEFPKLPAELIQGGSSRREEAHSSKSESQNSESEIEQSLLTSAATGLLELNAIIVKACHHDPRQRHASAHAMGAELELLREGQSVRKKRVAERRLVWVKKVSIAAAAIALFATGVTLLLHRFTGSPVQRITGVPEVNSIAVLPFVNGDNQEAHEYLATILSDETRNALTNCPGLCVAPRPTAFAFKHATNNFREIGEQLGVRTILAGSLKKTSNQLYVAARLINVADGAELWSAAYDHYRQSTNIVEITRQVVSNVAHVLKLSLPPAASGQMETNLVPKLAAYQLYSRARPLAWNTQDGNNKATELLNRAIAEDANFAEAHATLALCYSEATGFLLPAAQAMTAAKASALRAIQLDDTLLHAHTALGTVFLLHELNFTNAEVEFQRAIALAPRNGGTYGYYANALSYWGRFTNADQVLKQGEQVDPKNHDLQGTWCRRYYFERRFPDMLRQVTQFQALHPKSVMGFLFLAQAHERMGNYAEALNAVERMNQMDPAPDGIALQGMIHARMGHQDEARKALEEIRVNVQSRRASPLYSAQVLLALRQNEPAIEQLQRAVSDYGPSVLNLKTDPVWDDLRSEARFAELLKKGGLEN